MKKTVIAILILLFAAGVKAADSPTGRNPKLLWTPARQDVWNRMVSENNTWWQKLKWHINNNDAGQYNMIAYQMTGTASYAQAAWDAISTMVVNQTLPGDPNVFMDNYAFWVLEYDWLYPWLSATQRSQFLAFLNAGANFVLTRTRTTDSDESCGHYFGLAWLDMVAGTSYLSQSWDDGAGGHKPVGGLDWSGNTGCGSMRDAIHYFTKLAAGGTWLESSMYNLSTMRYVFLGAEGVRTATGVDHFPEITALQSDAALNFICQMTPDLNDNYHWGDEEHSEPGDLWWFHRQVINGILSGLLQGTEAGRYIQHYALETAAGSTDRGAIYPTDRFYFLFNPYAADADWRTSPLLLARFSPGMGLLLHHSGWGVRESMFAAQMAARTGVDHDLGSFGNFGLWRKGSWVVTSVKGYGSETFDHTLTGNTLVIGSYSNVSEAAGATNEEAGADNSYAYLAGSVGGKAGVFPGYYDSPPEFYHEWTRSILYLPGNGGQETIILYDRVDAEDPLAKDSSLTGYYPAEKTAIKNAPAMKEWILHTPVSPTLNAGSLNWISSGQQVRLSTLLPASQKRTIYNESTLSLPGYYFADQIKWHVRISPTAASDWNTFLNVIRVGDSAIIASDAKLASASGDKVEGVAVSDAPSGDVVALFSAEQGTRVPPNTTNPLIYDDQRIQKIAARRVLKNGYSVDWTSAGSAARVFLFDLDRSRSWQASVDGAAYASLPLSANDVAQLSVTGTGPHTLSVRTSGAVDVRPAVRKDPLLRAFAGDADKLEVTIFDVAGRMVHSVPLKEFPAGTASGRLYPDYVLTGKRAAGVYYAVVHGRKGGDAVRGRMKFAVIR